MLLDRALSIITITIWALLVSFAGIYLIRTTLRQGIVSAVRKLFSRLFFVMLFAAIAITLLSESLVFIEPQEVGVVVSLIMPEGYHDQPFRSGLRWIAPLMEQVYRYPIYWQTYTMSGRPTEGQKIGNDSIVARTSDGQEVSIDCSVIFRIDSERAIQVHIDWQGRYIEGFVRPVLRGLIRTQVSQYTVDEVNSSKRLDLEKDLSSRARAVLEDKGFVMDSFVLRNITFSPEYAASVEQKQVALQDAIQKEHQADQIRKLAAGEADRIVKIADAEAEAVIIKAQAETEALKLIAEALAQRPDLITYRYVDKLAPGIRVMLVPSNAPYILPLPSLEAETPGTPTPAVALPTPAVALPTPGAVFTPTLTLTPTPVP
jgi:regulator of protease activity HflC (stomatin/prohibitin superfamily)